MTNVEVLVATHNGRVFLADQIDSLIWQETKPWRITVRDAGSSDDTLDIVHRYDLRVRPHIVRAAPAGYARAHLDLLRVSSDRADAYAFCGQDDIWHENKLSRAVQALARVEPGVPALYCARARLIGPDAAPLGFTGTGDAKIRPARILFHPVAVGATFVLNRAARDQALAFAGVDLPFWDWWLMLALVATGARVIFDRQPTVDYRVHVGKWLAEGWGLSQPGDGRGLRLADVRRVVDLHLAALAVLGQPLTGQAEALVALAARWARDWQARRRLAMFPGLDGGSALATLRLRAALLSGRI